MSPPGCPVGLSFHPLQRQLLGVALAVGGCSLEELNDLEWWLRRLLGGPANCRVLESSECEGDEACFR